MLRDAGRLDADAGVGAGERVTGHPRLDLVRADVAADQRAAGGGVDLAIERGGTLDSQVAAAVGGEDEDGGAWVALDVAGLDAVGADADPEGVAIAGVPGDRLARGTVL